MMNAQAALVFGEGDVINSDGSAAGIGGMKPDSGGDATIEWTQRAQIEFVDPLGAVGGDGERDAFVERRRVVPLAIGFGDEIDLGLGTGGGGHADDNVAELM